MHCGDDDLHVPPGMERSFPFFLVIENSVLHDIDETSALRMNDQSQQTIVNSKAIHNSPYRLIEQKKKSLNNLVEIPFDYKNNPTSSIQCIHPRMAKKKLLMKGLVRTVQSLSFCSKRKFMRGESGQNLRCTKDTGI